VYPIRACTRTVGPTNALASVCMEQASLTTLFVLSLTAVGSASYSVLAVTDVEAFMASTVNFVVSNAYHFRLSTLDFRHIATNAHDVWVA
jgi:hypothetical protein